MKYWHLFKNFLNRFLAYRTRVAIWLITDSAQFVILPFVWLAIVGQGEISGYNGAQIVTYYIIAAIISLSFTSHVSRVVKRDILEGKINVILLRPLRHFAFYLIDELAYKALSMTMGVVLFTVLYLVIPEYVQLPTAAWQWPLFIVSLFIAFFISHLLEYTLGLASFWFGEIRALQHVLDIMLTIFSGRLAPLAFFPLFFAGLAQALPFSFLTAVPADIFLGQITAENAAIALLWAMFWIAFLSLFAFIAWRRGIRQYEGVGI